MIPSDKLLYQKRPPSATFFLAGLGGSQTMRRSRWVSHAAARHLASSGMRGARVAWEG